MNNNNLIVINYVHIIPILGDYDDRDYIMLKGKDNKYTRVYLDKLTIEEMLTKYNITSIQFVYEEHKKYMTYLNKQLNEMEEHRKNGENNIRGTK